MSDADFVSLTNWESVEVIELIWVAGGLIGTGHYLYKLKTKKKHQIETIETQRRYTEFDELQKLLAMRYPACICPNIPQKDIRNKILDKESQTVQERLQGIRKFLKELLEHEQLN